MASTSSNGRTKRGTFAPGNKHGRGAVPAATRGERLVAAANKLTAVAAADDDGLITVQAFSYEDAVAAIAAVPADA